MNELYWSILGFASQGLFFGRFLIQWQISELKKESIIPDSFWILSIIGGLGILAYSIHILDPVFIVAAIIGLFFYYRNATLTKNKEGFHFIEEIEIIKRWTKTIRGKEK